MMKETGRWQEPPDCVTCSWNGAENQCESLDECNYTPNHRRGKMNYYPKAIEILVNPDTDIIKLLTEIVKQRPSAIVKADKALRGKGWEEKVKPFLRKSQRLQAIKLCRELTGMGLKDANDAVEAIKL